MPEAFFIVDESLTLPENRPKLQWLLLAVIVGIATFFRLYELGVSAFRADTILLWDLALRKVAPGLVFSKWFEVSGAAGQMPMPAYIMQQFLELSGWNITPFMVRLPFAFFGILAVPVAFLAGRRLLGSTFGLLFSLLLAVNSFHIAVSREAYFYSMSFFGYFLYFWAAVRLVDKLWNSESLSWGDAAVLVGALFFTGYSQVTGFLICAVGALLFFGVLIYRGRKEETFVRNLVMLIVVHAVVLLPVVIASWGLRPILSQIGANLGTAKQVVSLRGENMFSGLMKALPQFAWGWTPIRWTLLVAALGGAIFTVIRRKAGWAIWMAYMIVAQLVLFAIVRTAASATYEARYMSGIFPFYLFFLTYGLLYTAGALLAKINKAGLVNGITAGFCAIGVGLCIYPAYLQTQITGKPVPYWDLVRWVDSNLPRGTPVLVDRWFEPWNELRAHPSTNVIFTFTIPNEPIDAYVKNRWRDTVKAFFLRNPDGVYVEMAKSYYDAPTVGPWDWPKRYFSQHVGITNVAGMKLRQMGLANRGGFYAANTNRVVLDLYFDTRDDLLQKAQKVGQPLVMIYGDGFAYEKTGPMQIFRVPTQNFMDWRVISQQATLDLYNLSDQPMQVALGVRGVSVGGAKKLDIVGGPSHTFPAGQMDTWNIGVVELKPGLTPVVFRDTLWGGVAASTLLVDSFQARAVEGKPSDQEDKDS